MTTPLTQMPLAPRGEFSFTAQSTGQRWELVSDKVGLEFESRTTNGRVRVRIFRIPKWSFTVWFIHNDGSIFPRNLELAELNDLFSAYGVFDLDRKRTQQ